MSISVDKIPEGVDLERLLHSDCERQKGEGSNSNIGLGEACKRARRIHVGAMKRLLEEVEKSSLATK